jgi:YD repeat-containing protein
VTAKYDPLGQLYELRDPIANDPSLCSTLAMGSQCATQDHVTEVIWDSFGRRVRIDDPDSGAWTYRYDDAGLLKERTQNGGTAASRSQFMSYDALQRLTAKAFVPTE